MTDADLLTLAKIIGRSSRVKLSTVSRWATDNRNPRLFERLARGDGISRASRERTAEWFRQKWPPDLIWPDHVPRRCPPKRAA